MAPEKAPAFQAYPRDFVGDLDVAALDLEQVGFYWMLLCYAWMKDGLPDDFSKISRALRISTAKFQKLWAVVGEKFYRDDEGKWRNARQEEEREKQREYREERSLAGKRGNAQRWGEARSAIAEPSRSESLSDENGIAKHRSSSALACTYPPSPPQAGGFKAITRGERKRAERLREAVGRCTHQPTCVSWEACIATIVVAWREQAAEVLAPSRASPEPRVLSPEPPDEDFLDLDAAKAKRGTA